MFHPSNNNHDTKQTFMCHSVPILLHDRNVTGSQQDANLHPEHLVFVGRMFLTHSQIRICLYQLPSKSMPEILLTLK